MGVPFPKRVELVAAEYDLSPQLAFGLGEGLNLYYSRRPQLRPPHRLHVLPVSFEEKLATRLAQPRQDAIAAALAGNGYGVMICTGDWHGLDAIEKWAEDLSLWPMLEGWESSLTATAELIEQSDGLYRRSYSFFLQDAMKYFENLEHAHRELLEIADDWLLIASQLRTGRNLERLSSRILRMASRESRFWGLILDQFGEGI